MDLGLPTDNDALFTGDGADFYQYVTRDFKGEKSNPWEGGQYGFVRNPVETPGGIIYSRFHEGIDIKPLQRDARGEPLDEVRAIADGKVVYANLAAGASNYGRYVVVEHHWEGSDYYSLYGHLASVAVEPGRKVSRGERLGIMGHTGDGLDQTRAHVHLELNLMLSRHFQAWYVNSIKSDPNRHGIYNGINLNGLDIARLYLAQRRRPGLTIPQFLADEETFYKVALPGGGNLDLVERYPWLLRKAPPTPPASWVVSFNAAGVPLQVTPGEDAVPSPTLAYVKKTSGSYAERTRGMVTGSGEKARLSENAQRLMQLLIWPE